MRLQATNMPSPSNDVLRMNRSNSPPLEPTGERMVPESSGKDTFWEHVYRYGFATRFVRGKRVLDIACGEGYGAAALQKAGAANVTGVDIAEDVCLHARDRYGLDARAGSGEHIPLADQSVDVVVSFETIEHVDNPLRFLDECVRVLAPQGRLIISTPNKGIYGADVKNPYHCSEMTEEEFATALRARFRRIDFYSQHPHSAAWWSFRALAADVSTWKTVSPFNRLHRSAQFRLAPRTVYDPTDEERASAIELILAAGRNQRPFLSPYALRPRRKWNGEKPTYIIANATGPCRK